MVWKRRKRSPRRRSLGFTAWRVRARLFWLRIDKTPLVIAGLLIVVGGVFTLVLQAMTADSEERQNVRCLALNVYFEARGEPEAGQYAVAEVTMNRVASPSYPDTVCEVVYQKNWDTIRGRYVAAFSWTEIRSLPEPHGREWRRA